MLGVNGLVWVSPHDQGAALDATGMGDGLGAGPADGGTPEQQAAAAPPLRPAEAAATARVAAAVGALRALFFAVHPDRISAVVRLADERGVPTADMCQPAFLAQVVAQEMDLRAGSGGEAPAPAAMVA